MYTRTRRWCYSSVGGALGSVFWPGFGTLVGIGAGEGWAELQPDPEPSWLMFSSGEDDSDMKKAANETGDENPELTCGCCQVNTFSADPGHRERAPVSSRACDHTICRSCVHRSHSVAVEQSSTEDDWIRCPLCKSDRAFSPFHILVNRILCAAISALEKQRPS